MTFYGTNKSGCPKLFFLFLVTDIFEMRSLIYQIVMYSGESISEKSDNVVGYKEGSTSLSLLLYLICQG